MANFVSYEDLVGRFNNLKTYLVAEFGKRAHTITINGTEHTVVDGAVDLGTTPTCDCESLTDDQKNTLDSIFTEETQSDSSEVQ